MLSLDAVGDVATMAEIVGQVVLEPRTDLLDDEDTRWLLEDLFGRSKARERSQGRKFSRRSTSAWAGWWLLPPHSGPLRATWAWAWAGAAARPAAATIALIEMVPRAW